ncbi:MAG: efflux transporter, permease protein [Gemmatimonadetes bacterium]|nr:efflux transporter, permease protein [Gemmatimonadota bacterium]
MTQDATRRVTHVCIRLLERSLRPDVAVHVAGDLAEQQERGALWTLRETLFALVHLHARPHTGDGLMSTFLADLRIAARLLRRSPAFAIVAVLTLGLAIGATTAIFSVIEPVLLRPLPYPDPERLTFVWERDRDGGRSNIGYATFRDVVDQSRTIERAAAIGSWQPTISGTGDPERVNGDRVSWTFFRTLGVHPALGRDFTASEDVPGSNQVVILSYGLWQRKYGGDPAIVGRTVSVNDGPMTVVGVMPASFDNVVSPGTQIWRALGYANQSFACRTCRHLRMLARIKPGVGMASAATELDQIHRRIEKQFPDQYASVGASVVSVQDQATLPFRPALLALSGAVVLVLLIAVANVVNLQLARAVRREEEFAIRTALGAARSRLLRQLITEGLLLATLGGAAGLLVARISIPILVGRLPQGMPRLAAIQLDVRALLAVAALVLVLAILMGLAPARSRRGDLGATLRSGRRLSSTGNHLTRAALVVGEVALAVMLLVSAGLVARSLVRLLAVDAGFDASHLLTLEVNSIGTKYPTNASVVAYHDRVRSAVAALPGVTSVAVANQLPLGGNADSYGVIDADNIPANPELAPNGDRYVVSPGYFSTMRVPILRGRTFTAAEAADTVNNVALVSAALADRMWPGQNPLGKRIVLGGPKGAPRTVIGVAGNVRHGGLDAATTLQWYTPEAQWLFADNQEVLVVRTSGDPAALANAVRRAIAAIDPAQPIVKIATMDQVIAMSTTQRHLALVLFGAFAVAALLLAVAGIYGVLAGSVAERTREIGVRSALGATPSDIVALVVGQGGRLAVAGIVFGLAGSFALTRFLRTLLFGIGPNDPVTLGGVVALLSLVTLAACLIPAMRAARVDPSWALRSE